MTTHTAIDLRIFRNGNALGLLNAMAGYFHVDGKVLYLVDQSWMEIFLRQQKIPEQHIVRIRSPFDLFKLGKLTVILPLQRSKLDVFVLRVLGLIGLKTFVHDLHFLSRRPLLAMEFRGPAAAAKKALYLFFIRFADQILVDSRLVQRQVRSLFQRDSCVVSLKRIFSKDDLHAPIGERQPRTYDYFIPLSGRPYKGTWVLDRLQFEDPKSSILVDSSHYESVRRLMSGRNPQLRISHRNLRAEADLIGAFSDAAATLCLSRHEGFGFVPYEAAFFGSLPVVLNCTTYIEVPRDAFTKLRISDLIHVPSVGRLTSGPRTRALAMEHVVLA